MKVFVVLSTHIDGWVQIVCSSREKAEAYILANPDMLGDKNRIQTFDIDVEGDIYEASWPARVIKSLGRAPQVGDWFAECCIQDFHQIASDAELAALLERYDDQDSGGSFWKTEAQGRAHLADDRSADGA